jgi:hypothetical protein
MSKVLFILWTSCTAANEPNYARTTGPMGVTNNSTEIDNSTEDTGETDTGDTGN